MSGTSHDEIVIGLDVGSTTVKAVVVDAVTDEILWKDYQRHETKQPEKVLEFLERIQVEIAAPHEKTRVFITGSGGSAIAGRIGGRFVQEVNAVSLAVEKLYPETGSVIELGGQDAKIIIYKEDPETGKKKKFPSMNDKCAGGTGAVIDKINAKLRIPPEELCNQGYFGIKLHPVAGKCGVFAETDINGLQKSGVPRDELMASLFESIIQQNLSVLTRGNTLRPVVLLLGGPNTYIKGMRDCWKANIPKIWEERKYPLPEGVEPEELIRVPENAQYFAAIGAVEYGKSEEPDVGRYVGYGELERFILHGRAEMRKGSSQGLARDDHELRAFREKYRVKKFGPPRLERGETVDGFIGIDGGSTSTKAVLLDREARLIAKAYQLSKGNPIEDTIEMFRGLRDQVEKQGATLRVMGVGTTGYAKDMLKETVGADVALVETVAHTQAALHYYKNVDVICDVGGQDIKLILMRNGRVVDFKLNTQCSAGNGYFLQSTAQGFGVAVEDFADAAFKAESFPEFGYGCAVFMQSDIVDFQRQGWKAEEIMAGLASVLPKNIWLYVSQIPNLAKLGTNFVLQGGTQHNLAAVKSQVDFIESRFKGEQVRPNIIVHEHTGESGAIGAALEARRLAAMGMRTRFIGLDAVESISYKTTRSEDTRCYFCKNKCLRTFIDVRTAGGNAGEPAVAAAPKKEANGKLASKVPLEARSNRLIIATCEKGAVEDVDAMREIKKGIDQARKENPNLVEIAAREAWRSWEPARVADSIPRFAFTPAQRARVERMRLREKIVIGVPRVLNMYNHMPFFSAYFECLGVKPDNIVYSDFTTEQLYKEGSKRGAIDPCFPSKLGIPHVHNLLHVQHKRKKLDYIFFPMVDCIPTDLKHTMDSRACPTVVGTSKTVEAAFTKEGDIFAEHGVRYLSTFLNMSERSLFEKQLFEEFEPILGVSRDESARAVAEGFAAMDRFTNGTLRRKAREVLDMLERENRIGLVLLGRPYHNDPGINHEILEEFQKAGYPILSQDSLPIDEDILERLFGEDVRGGIIRHPLDISDVWKNSYSENTNRKVWGAKFTARHPNLVALEMSSFKCGHDAPIYTAIQEIVECSGTPYFSFKDIDENKPTGSIRIRVETITYFLKRYREDMIERQKKIVSIEEQLKQYEELLRTRLAASASATESFNSHGVPLPALDESVTSELTFQA